VPADAYARAGRFQGWEPRLLLGADVHHKTLGLVGFGRIGRAVARRAAGFGMRVLYTGRGRSGAGGRPEPGARRVELEELLAESDFVSLHVPLTPRTRHLINAGSLARMKPGAYLINTSRGEVVDENALAAALGEGRLAGAGLDVFEREPEIHPDLLGLENVVLAPHIGSASLETRTAMGRLAADNLRAVLVEGSRPPACVNPEIYD
jgi:glyoxylate reductase